MATVSSRNTKSRASTRRASTSRTERASRNTVEAAHDIQKVVSTLQLATSPTRMTILLLLAEGEKYAGEIREALRNPSQPSVSHQLSLLRHGRLVESRREGRKIVYRLSDAGRLVVQAFDKLDT
ncbi:MAG TPA: metalloregulator ArsR/SmtB family transcription factor [Isosphaeraceae bacterium]|nr:metalloregulator ArsR/SmtB family transcription factor [Isosphaeraceae bacterium]